MELAIPVNKISSLSSGEFVGMVADNPDQKIELKAFCGSRIKINFLKSDQLEKIAIHFRKYEKLIYNSSVAKGLFLESMKNLFFTHGVKLEIIDDVKLDSALANNKSLFTGLKAGKPLKP